MSYPIHLTVASGQAVSGAFTLPFPQQAHHVEVPSLSAVADVRVQFTPTSGDVTTMWDLQTYDGVGLPFVGLSGAGPGRFILPMAPTPWGRFSFTGSQSDIRSLAIWPVK